MGFLKGLFGNSTDGKKKEVNQLPWQVLDAVPQLTEIEKRSQSKTQVIFKHSTSCGISRMVMNMFVSNYDFTPEQVDLYYLDLLANREVSNETGYTFQVMHQSPQLLVIRNGVAVAHASHGAIADIDLNQYV